MHLDSHYVRMDLSRHQQPACRNFHEIARRRPAPFLLLPKDRLSDILGRRAQREARLRKGKSMSTSRPMNDDGRRHLAALNIPLERDGFTRTLLRHLAGALQDVVGLEEASGFVSMVGQRMGDEINELYRTALGKRELTRSEVAAVLVDLKARIQGDFYVIDESEERIVLGNRRCPFEDRVIGRPALCMMTSNVFGSIAAEHLGYAKVTIEQAIARGDAGCRVVVHLRPSPSVDGREYVRELRPASA
jgi:hypothetical protein